MFNDERTYGQQTGRSLTSDIIRETYPRPQRKQQTPTGLAPIQMFPKTRFQEGDLSLLPARVALEHEQPPTVTPILSVQPRKPGECVHEERVGIHSSATGTQTGQSTRGHEHAKNLACEAHVSAHTAQRPRLRVQSSYRQHTHFAVCVRMCTDTDYSFKKRRENTKSQLTVGGLVGGREEVARTR